MKKVLTVNCSSEYWPHADFGERCNDTRILWKSPEDVALVVYPGGSDVDPSLYGHKKHPRTGSSLARDKRDLAVFHQAKEKGVPCVGICRGGQFLTVASGGFMYQDVSGHAIGGTHLALTYDKKLISVTSSHHQMFGWPLPEGAQPLMWSFNRLSRWYETEPDVKVVPPPKELEGVYYPHTESLAVQWHPEWMEDGSKSVDYYKGLLEKFLRPLVDKRFKIAVPAQI